MSKNVALQIAKHIDSTLEMEALLIQDGGFHLRTVVETSFLIGGKGASKEKLAALILTTLFAKLMPGFQFEKVLKAIGGPKDRATFLTELLYHIWSSSFPLEQLVSTKRFTNYLYHQAAGVVSDRSLKCIWSSLSADEKFSLLKFSFKHLLEGTFRLLEIARPEFSELCELYERGLIDPTQPIEIDAIKKNVELRTKKLQKLLGEELSFTKKFVQLFGLYGHQVPESVSHLQAVALDEKIGEAVTEFNESVFSHVQALKNSPHHYKEGLDHVVLAVPTYNRLLSTLPWLQSMRKSLTLFCETIDEAQIEDYPLFVLDQSEPAIYEKNRRYIKKLGTGIIHLSRDECIVLAEKLAVDKLIVTAPNKRFGFAGARNAVFFLTPLLHALYCEHREKCFEVAMKMPSEKLKKLFSDVMFDPNKTPAVYMGDDDWWVPPATLFSEALFAYRHKEQFFWRSGFHEGRYTTRVNACIEPNTILHGSGSILSQFSWADEGIIHGMSGALSKPKICVNIPYGQEEPHFQPMHNIWHDFRRPSYHLAGVRYPEHQLPTNHFSGLANYLRKLNSYVFELFQVTEILQPPHPETSPLVWNRQKKPFNSFKDAIEVVASTATKEAMQKQFWENVAQYVTDFNRTEFVLSDKIKTPVLLQMLIDLDRDKMFHDYFEINPLANHFKEELLDLKNYMGELAEEARYYKAFATELLKQKCVEGARKTVEARYKKPIMETIFAKALYLIALSAAEGGFQNALHELSKITSP